MNHPPLKMIKFDPEKHCGAPVRNRNPEFLSKALLRAQHGLAHLRPTTNDYDAKKARYESIIRTATEKLERLAKNPDDRPCCVRKGLGTDHKGEGHCCRHCACHGRRSFHDISGNLYRQVHHRKLQDALSAVEMQTLDIMDLVPEAKMLKALTVVFFEEAERRKHLSPEEIDSAAALIDKTGRMIERINSIRLKTGLITFEAVDRLTTEMGQLLIQAANERNGLPLNADEFVKTIKQLWGGIKIDTNTRALPLPPHKRLVN